MQQKGSPLTQRHDHQQCFQWIVLFHIHFFFQKVSKPQTSVNQCRIQQIMSNFLNFCKRTCIFWEVNLELDELTLFGVDVLGLAVVNELIIELMELLVQHLMRRFLLSQIRPLIIRVNWVFIAVFLDR